MQRPAVTKHLKNIFESEELEESSVSSILEHTASDGKNYKTKYYNLDAFLDLAESRAKRNIPMTMEDWAKRVDAFLEFDDREILKNAGKITKKIADEHAFSEFEKYRVVQDRLFMSDFDKLLLDMENDNE